MQDDTFDTDTEPFEGASLAVEPAKAPEQDADGVFITWNKKRFEVVITQYVDNGNTCICLLNPDTGVLEAKATANLSQLPAHYVYIKDYSENRGIAAVLSGARLLRKTGATLRNGSEEFEQYEILPRLGKHFSIDLPDDTDEPEVDPDLSQAIPDEKSSPGPQAINEPEAATTHAEMEAQQAAALVQKAQEDAAEKAAIAEDAKDAPA